MTIQLVQVTLKITAPLFNSLNLKLVGEAASHGWKLLGTALGMRQQVFSRLIKMALLLRLISVCLAVLSVPLSQAKSMFCDGNSNLAAFLMWSETLFVLGEPLFRMAENVLRLAINDVASGLLGDDQSLFTVAFLQTTAIVCHGLEALMGQLLGHHAKINMADPLFVQFVITACCMIEQLVNQIEPLMRQAGTWTKLIYPIIPAVQFVAAPVAKVAAPITKMAASPFFKMADQVTNLAYPITKAIDPHKMADPLIKSCPWLI